MLDRGWGVSYCAGEKFESMDDAIALADCGLGEVVVHKLNGVRKKEYFGDGIVYMEAAVVVECWTDVEAFAAAEVPIFYCVGEKVESMDNAITLADCGMGETVVHKLNRPYI